MNVYCLRANSNKYRGVIVKRGSVPKFDACFNGRPIERRTPRVTIAWDPDMLRFPKGDYPSLFTHIPLFSRRAVTALEDLLEGAGELIPVSISDETYYLFNVTRVIDTLDASRSDIIRYSDSGILDIRVHYFVEDRIGEAPIFKLPEIPDMDVFVTDVFVARVKQAQLKGFRFPFLWGRDETGEETARETTIFD